MGKSPIARTHLWLHILLPIVAATSLGMSQQTGAQAPPYEFTVLESRNVPLGTFPIGSWPTINNMGVVAYMRGDGVAGLVINDGLSETVIDLTSIVGFPVASAKPFINDQGAVGIGHRSTLLGEIFRINPDSSVTTLATIDFNGLGEFKDVSGFDYGMNNSGQLAAKVRLNSDEDAIVLLDDSGNTIIDTEDPTERFNFVPAAINDAGVVAYRAEENATDPISIFTSDGISPVQKALQLPSDCGNSAAGPDINNTGLVAASLPGCLPIGTGGAITELVVDQNAYPFPASIGNLGFNNAGQVVFQIGGVNDPFGLYFGDDPVDNKLIEEGDLFFGAPVVNGDFGGDGGMNDRGQIVFRVQTLSNENAPTSYLVRADPVFVERLIALPDVGESAAQELGAVLLGSLNGYVRDASTDGLLGTLVFNTNRIPLDAGLVDIDGSPALAVLQRDATGRAWVEVRDAVTGNLVRDVWYSSGFTPVALAVLPDLNGNSVSDLAVLLTRDSDNDRAWVHIKDASTGALVKTVWFEAGFTPLDVEYVPNVDVNPGGEIAVLMTRDSDSRTWVHVKDAQTGANIRHIWFETGFTPKDLAVIDNVDANPGSEVAVLFVRDSDSRPWAHLKDAATGAWINNVWFETGFIPLRLVVVPGFDPNAGDELAVLMTRESDSRTWVHIKDAASGAFAKNVWFQGGFVPRDFAVLPNMDANPASEIAVLGFRGSGQAQVEIKDAETGANINQVDFP